MRRKRLFIGTIVLAAAVGIVAASRWTGEEQDSRTTAEVERGDFVATVDATGKLEAAVAFEIGPPSARDFWQYNLEWMIPEGTRVKKGDVIARFDTQELDDRLRTDRADLETTLQKKEKEERNLEVQLKSLNLDLVKAEGDLKKLDVQAAVPEDIVSSIEIQQLELQRDLARRRLEFLREKVAFERDLVKSKLELLETKKVFHETKIRYNEETKEKFAVKAPTDGMVVYIPKHNGDRWEVGEGVWMLAKILEIADISTLQVEVDVLEVDSAKIEVGQPVEVTVDAMPGSLIQTKVADLGRMVREKSVNDPSKVFDAILPLEGHSLEGLRPGMGVTVKIETNRITGALTIPLEAVRMGADGTYVEVQGDNGTEVRFVELGERNRKSVLVLSGLEKGEVVTLRSSA